MRILDVHAHIGSDKDGGEQTPEQLLASMDANGIDYAAVFPFNERSGDLVGASLRLLGLNEKRFICFFRFDPKTLSPEELAANLPKFRGVKLHPRSQEFDPLDKRYYPLYEVIAKSGKPLLMHTRKSYAFSNPDNISKLAEEFTDLKLILGHFAESSEEAVGRVARCENLYLETSIDSIHPKRFARVTKAAGVGKVLFGSDVPYSDQELELMKVMKSTLTYEEKEKVLYGNAARLLGL